MYILYYVYCAGTTAFILRVNFSAAWALFAFVQQVGPLYIKEWEPRMVSCGISRVQPWRRLKRSPPEKQSMVHC